MNLYKYSNLIVITIFALSLTAPLVGMLLKLDHTQQLRENRTRAKVLELPTDRKSLGKFPHDFYAYFRDNFGFRDSLTRLNFIIRRPILQEREFNDVLFGNNGWLFYLGEREMDDSRGITHYDEETLAAWTASLERKRQWLAAKGIRYIFVIAPNKATIYGENLPPYFTKLHDRTGLDELVDYVRIHSSVEVLDLRHALLMAKKQERIYKKTDTHWNEYGAFIAHQEIMKTISRWFPAKPLDTLSDYFIEKRAENGGDLSVLVGGSEFITETGIYLVPKKARLAREIEVNAGEKSITTWQGDVDLPRALVFRDSFFDGIMPFFSEQFQYVKYFRRHWDDSVPIASIIKDVQPDVVIEEFMERRLKMDMGNFILQ